MTFPAPTLPNLDFKIKIYIYVMTKMIYALCVCVFNLLKIYTNLPLAERGPRAAAIYPGPAAAAAMPVQGAREIGCV